MNHISGFVNSYMGIALRPNATLAWSADAPLGQRSLVIRLLKDIQFDAEIMIGYGPLHTCKDPHPKTVGPKKAKTLKPQKRDAPVL